MDPSWIAFFSSENATLFAEDASSRLPYDHPMAKGTAYRDAPAQPDEAAAVECAKKIAWRWGLHPRTLQQLFTQTEYYEDTYRRALHVIERREVVLGVVPASAQSRSGGITGFVPDPRSVDPWQVDPATIEDVSHVVAHCPECEGLGTVECPSCAGSSRVRCPQCGGGGRVAGKRGTKQCPSCRAKGTVPCSECTRGQVPCDTCAASGIVEAWLSVEQSEYEQVVVHPRKSAAALVHRHVDKPDDFDLGAWTSVLVSDSGAKNRSKIPETLQPNLDPWADRVLATRIQKFTADVHRFSFNACFATGYIEVAGEPPAVSRSSNLRPLIYRLIVAAGAFLFGFLISRTVVNLYLKRHAWFASYGDVEAVGALGLVAAILLAVTAAGLVLPRRLWNPTRAWGPLGAALLAMVGVGVAWGHSGPSAAGLQAALSADDVERARVEAEALRALGIDEEAGAKGLDALHMRRVERARSLRELANVVDEPWARDESRQEAVQVLRTRATAEVATQFKEGSETGLTEVARYVAPFDEAIQKSADGHASLLRAEGCIKALQCECVKSALTTTTASGLADNEVQPARDRAVAAFGAAVTSRLGAVQPTHEVHAQQAALRSALEAARCYHDLTGKDSEPPTSKIEADLKVVDAQVEAADKRAAALAAQEEARRKAQEAAEEARRKAQEAAEEARQRAKEAARDSASLQCCDGSLSPSCTCGRADRRGCCSRHKGVCGCSAD